MEELLKKLSSYNIFNYLFPGVIFIYAAKELEAFDLMNQELVIVAFLAYFLGLIISRLGSTIVEPLLKKIKFVKFEAYPDFLKAEQNDPKITIFSEQNNMYRTLISLFFCILLMFIYTSYRPNLNWSYDLDVLLLVIIFLIIFLFSYQKQTNYISKRIINKK